MRTIGLTMLLAIIPVCRAADLTNLPPNTWMEIRFTNDQPSDQRDENGRWGPAGWNKLVYDRDGKRVLFYDRWVDKKHGGVTIYGNCLFGFDPAAAKVTPIKIDNWAKTDTKDGGYRTLALAENDKTPTPCSRHVYHAFEYVPELKSVFLCNGANQTALRADGKLVGHDLCDGTWRLDLTTDKWTKIDSPDCPPNRLDDAMAYCPDTQSIIYTGVGCQLWVFELDRDRWRKSEHSPPPHGSMGRTIFYDPSEKRMLVVGGGALDAWMKGEAREFRELYAFDPRTETVRRLADAPRPSTPATWPMTASTGCSVRSPISTRRNSPPVCLLTIRKRTRGRRSSRPTPSPRITVGSAG
jgi:hypothetical protein